MLGIKLKLDSKHKAKIVIGTFFVLVSAFLAGLIYYAVIQHRITDSDFPRFSKLDEVFLVEGLETFLIEKEALRRQLILTLQHSDDVNALTRATNIAVYLFPEVLSSDNLEKDQALLLWAPLQKAIERAPQTPESRALFDEMRANIWNYENPDRESPQVSMVAKQVIHIYDALSSPKRGGAQ